MADHLETITLSLTAMATRFELVLHGADSARLRAAGEQAFDEIERLEAQLSFYRADSLINWLNRRASIEAVKVDPRVFRLLKECARLSSETDGAFDVTIGPLMRAWGFVEKKPAVPEPSELDEARRVVGMNNIEFDEDDFTIRFKQAGVEIDLGGYAKGYAIERAADILRESGIASALLHGGTSSVFAIGAPPDQQSWKIALSAPLVKEDEPLIVELNDEALSVSAVHGKSFSADGRVYGHVIDPRAGEPVSRAEAAAVAGPSPSVCEALSTALLVLGPDWLAVMQSRFAGYRAFVKSE